AVIRLQCHCAVTAGNCRAVNIIAIEINGHAIIYSADAGGEHEILLQLDGAAGRRCFRSRTQSQVVGSASIPGNHDRLGGLVFHPDREGAIRIFHHAVTIPEGVGTVDNPRRLGAGEAAAGNFCCGRFCQTDHVRRAVALRLEGAAGEREIRAGPHGNGGSAALTGECSFRNGQLAGVGLACKVVRAHNRALGGKCAAGDRCRVGIIYGIAILAGLREVAAGNGQLSVIVILYCDLAAGKGAAVDGQLGLIPARAGLGLTIGAIFRCGAVLPAIADQAGIEAGVAIRKLHRDAIFDGHGAEILQHIPAVAAACVAAGTGLLRAGIGAALQGDGRIDVVVHRTPAMADVIHHAGLLRGGIHNGNPGAVVEDRM
ncbi:DNA polymerase III subunit beta, partial [Dysosmobacter welbionis]